MKSILLNISYAIVEDIVCGGVWLFNAQNANKQANLVEMKISFISSAGNSVGSGKANICLKAGGPHGENSTVISNSHLPAGHQRSDQPHLCVWYSQSSVPGLFVPISCSQCSELWQLKSWAQSSQHAVNVSIWCFSTYRIAHRIWFRILPKGL